MRTLDSRDDELQSLIAQIEASRSASSDLRTLVGGVAAIMARFTAAGTRLPDRFATSCPGTYAQHLIYVAPDRGFSLVSLVWRPGQSTPIHDHSGWCVVSVSRGCERETRYRVRDADGGTTLEALQTHDTIPGEAAAFLPDGTDVHRVSNCTDDTTLSLHAYGVDIERLGTSIKRRYEHLATGDPALVPF